MTASKEVFGEVSTTAYIKQQIDSGQFNFYNGRCSFNPHLSSWRVIESNGKDRYCLQQKGTHPNNEFFTVGFFN